VLVVEDEFLIALDLELLLKAHGWRVLGPVASVAAALRLLDSAAPDVALLDLNLRSELVTPVAEALQARDIPFVLASAYDQSAWPQGATALAQVPNVGKPAHPHRLLVALAQAARA
jgi:CheY-like chemotaxis protein